MWPELLLPTRIHETDTSPSRHTARAHLPNQLNRMHVRVDFDVYGKRFCVAYPHNLFVIRFITYLGTQVGGARESSTHGRDHVGVTHVVGTMDGEMLEYHT